MELEELKRLPQRIKDKLRDIKNDGNTNSQLAFELEFDFWRLTYIITGRVRTKHMKFDEVIYLAERLGLLKKEQQDYEQ